MADGKGISGLAVAFATAGGLLVYAGFRGVNPVQALREISTGKAGVTSHPTDLGAYQTGVALGAAVTGATGALVSSAAQKYANDKYSQSKRTQPGWSDCSSFCDKILTDVGIPPPVKWASTANYRLSASWITVQLSETQPGDVAVSSHHMVMITASGGISAIGQQNPRVNVQSGSVASLMGSQSYVCKRYSKAKVVTT
jgi:hypothetical protein